MQDFEWLKALLLQRMPAPGKYATAIEGFALSRRDTAGSVEYSFYKPSVGLIVQGEKRALVGSTEVIHREGQCFAVSLDMPGICFISEASGKAPFLAVTLDLDTYLVSRLASQVCPPGGDAPATGTGVVAAEADAPLLDAFFRLTELSGRQDGGFLAGLVIQEISYRLLTGPLGMHIRKFFMPGTRGNQVAQAVSWIRTHFMQPLRVEELARSVNMGTSTFHKYFKEITTLSPLQYHKRLRLYEAQRLMLAEDMDAVGASLAVGYESPSQFNREYKKLFGEPPRRDIMRRR